MRSDQIHSAIARGISRYEICQLVSKGVRVMHKSGSRYEDSINDVLEYLGTHKKPEGMHPAAVELKPAA